MEEFRDVDIEDIMEGKMERVVKLFEQMEERRKTKLIERVEKEINEKEDKEDSDIAAQDS